MCTESGMLHRCDCKIAKQQINITIIIMWLSFCDRQKKHFIYIYIFVPRHTHSGLIIGLVTHLSFIITWLLRAAFSRIYFTYLQFCPTSCEAFCCPTGVCSLCFAAKGSALQMHWQGGLFGGFKSIMSKTTITGAVKQTTIKDNIHTIQNNTVTYNFCVWNRNPTCPHILLEKLSRSLAWFGGYSSD